MSFIDRMRTFFQQARRQSPVKLMLADISLQCQGLADTLRERVEAAATGQHGMAEATIEYIIRDRTGGELQTAWQDNDYVTAADIIETDGYKVLAQNSKLDGIRLKLTEEQIEEVDDEERVRFCIVLSGWGK